jgi:ATP-dependent helicase/nuclease subunit A
METQGRNLLLSAAAGSGKTATLTARIIRSLTAPEQPADISRLLVVTFTRAAANELKTRISAALSAALTEQPGNRHLTRQLISLGSASICTIDSFCLSLVRANFQTLSLSPDFRLADETELAVLKRAMMDDLIEEYYDKNPTENLPLWRITSSACETTASSLLF